MYTPKKGWMRWKKIIQNNLVESDNGDIVYRLGEMSWQRHCIIYGNLVNLNYEWVAALFPITSFEKQFLEGWIYGSSDVYSFDMLDRHGYNILKKRNDRHNFFYDSDFRLSINENLLLKLNANGMLEKMEIEWGCGKTNLVENLSRIFSEEEKAEFRRKDEELHPWRKDFVYDE